MPARYRPDATAPCATPQQGLRFHPASHVLISARWAEAAPMTVALRRGSSAKPSPLRASDRQSILGTKTIGLSHPLGCRGRRIALALETLKRGKFTRDAAEIRQDRGTRFECGGHRRRSAAQHGWQRRPARTIDRKELHAQSRRRDRLPDRGLGRAAFSTMAVTRTLLEADALRGRGAASSSTSSPPAISCKGAIRPPGPPESARRMPAPRKLIKQRSGATNVDGEDTGPRMRRSAPLFAASGA